jgi:hypothetical protein
VGNITKTGQNTCPAGALQRTRKDLHKRELLQPVADLASALFAAFVQWQVRSTCFAACIGPFRIAMPC